LEGLCVTAVEPSKFLGALTSTTLTFWPAGDFKNKRRPAGRGNRIIVTPTSDIVQPRVTLSIVVFLMESPYDRKVARLTACVGMFPERYSVFTALSSERIGCSGPRLSKLTKL
jgi:hypothetical protein